MLLLAVFMVPWLLWGEPTVVTKKDEKDHVALTGGRWTVCPMDNGRKFPCKPLGSK
jgi:hypothetical protein